MKNINLVHTFQEKSGWCGIACWDMILKTLGSDISQSKLKTFISNPAWGTSHEDHDKIANNYFSEYQSKESWSLEDLKDKLNRGYMVICNMWDDYETYDKEPADGHYIVLKKVDDGKQTVKILDPSSSKRVNGRTKEYEMSFNEFNEHWYDFLDEEKTQRTDHWAICINPQSLKLPKKHT